MSHAGIVSVDMGSEDAGDVVTGKEFCQLVSLFFVFEAMGKHFAAQLNHYAALQISFLVGF